MVQRRGVYKIYQASLPFSLPLSLFPLPGLYICLSSQCHSLHPEDGGSKVLQNSGIVPKHFMVSQPRRP